MEALEVSSPYINKKIVLSDMEMLPQGPVISEGQDVDLQIERCKSQKPDLTIVEWPQNPLEALGLATKWSIELVFSPVHGYEQAGDLASYFIDLKRREVLQI